ncbi:P-loop containing nucleoside triphosphate hydrolase protein [Lineolata rhizophorae]|uniref:RNA helicase n=1 Tax=Lineolata rhizophorae TaxID=578093 RepID=A0A6A6NRM6_9PEZI|nr:P-loop containing nucleoside triphosphate hydrolase protein [Lineolata rhizophorae]
MKRKLNKDDIPESTPSTQKAELKAAHNLPSFDEFGLDARILQGVVKQKFAVPTPVQAAAIPLALEGKDILARSRTGSGKTAAYVLPILQSILVRKSVPDSAKCTSALILVPTRELAGQVTKVTQALSAYCGQEIRAENLTRKEDDKVQRARLANLPDIVVATPGRVAYHIKGGALSVEQVTYLVIDEADLVLSYGYEDDLDLLSKSLPRGGVQVFLMSATLKADLDALRGLFCRDPVVLELDEQEKEDINKRLAQYVVKCAEDEKFLLVYAIFKLELVKGKCIIFVADIDRCYRLKLFLEQFGIRSCVLNSELPVNSRIHVVEEFNKNVYDIIIATDEHEVIGGEESNQERKQKEIEAAEIKEKAAEKDNTSSQGGPEKEKEDHEEDKEEEWGGIGDKDGGKEGDKGGEEGKNQNEEVKDDNASISVPSKKEASGKDAKSSKKSRSGRPKDFGISRGIDFNAVRCVLNFDLPQTSTSYTHRIGRTARANNSGLALSFAIPKHLYRKHPPTSHPACANDEVVLDHIAKAQAARGAELKPYAFDMQALAGFRYRLGDALRAVTRVAVREARARELRRELLRSEKLRRRWEERPEEVRALIGRHDGAVGTARVQPHLKHVPEYLVPGGLGAKKKAAEVAPFVGLRKDEGEENRIRKARRINRMKGKGGKGGKGKPMGKKADPLKTFSSGKGRR